MGFLTLPSSGLVYVDAPIPIYTIDKHPNYGPICDSIWQAAQAGIITATSSELTLLETLVGPLRNQDAVLAARREGLWSNAGTRLIPITTDILREAARLRAVHRALKTPDAIHAATALLHGCVLFVTNDTGFRQVPGLPLAILDDILNTP